MWVSDKAVRRVCRRYHHQADRSRIAVGGRQLLHMTSCATGLVGSAAEITVATR